MYSPVLSLLRLNIYVIFLLTVLFACDSQQPKSSPTPEQSASPKKNNSKNFSPREETLIKTALLGSRFDISTASEVRGYQAQIQNVLNGHKPVLKLSDIKDKNALVAQQVLLEHDGLNRYLFHPDTSMALRNEVMSVKPALPGDLVGGARGCSIGECYRVAIYNFFYNLSIVGIVDVVTNRLLAVNTLSETQPDLSPRLEALAQAIAKHEPLVQAEVSRYLKSIDQAGSASKPNLLMASTKTSLKNSLCERSQHLCVAPTYVLGRQALWVIVDLTDFKVAGLRWTNLGQSPVVNAPPVMLTERKLENEYIYKTFCEQTHKVDRNGWSFDYHLTSSDGLRLADAKYQDKPVFNSAKVVDWHVSYSRDEQFGYSDATGCPMFSSAVVVAHQAPEIEAIIEQDEEVGFYIAQDFRQLPWPAPCNYRYEERYEFYNDGRYRVAMSNHGRGCGSDGTYRPVFRLALSNARGIEHWQKDQWSALAIEAWSLQADTSLLAEQKYSHRITGDSGSYLVAPSTGNFGDGGRGDNAYVYTTVNHSSIDEGESDLVTLGSCCNTDHRQGPEQFMQPAESLAGENLVFWYVPQMENDGQEGKRYCWAETQAVNGVAKTKTWPCTAGPMFVPVAPQ